MPDRYWVPASLPWRMPWVGSWCFQKICSSSVVTCSRRIEHHQHDLVMAGHSRADLVVGRIWRVSAGVSDRRRHDSCHAPRTHARRPGNSPSRTSAISVPAGNGPTRGVASTSWEAGTGMERSRPGRAAWGPASLRSCGKSHACDGSARARPGPGTPAGGAQSARISTDSSVMASGSGWSRRRWNARISGALGSASETIT